MIEQWYTGVSLSGRPDNETPQSEIRYRAILVIGPYSLSGRTRYRAKSEKNSEMAFSQLQSKLEQFCKWFWILGTQANLTMQLI